MTFKHNRLPGWWFSSPHHHTALIWKRLRWRDLKTQSFFDQKLYPYAESEYRGHVLLGSQDWYYKNCPNVSARSEQELPSNVAFKKPRENCFTILQIWKLQLLFGDVVQFFFSGFRHCSGSIALQSPSCFSSLSLGFFSLFLFLSPFLSSSTSGLCFLQRWRGCSYIYSVLLWVWVG